MGIPCNGLNGGSYFKHTEAFFFQIATKIRKRPTVTGIDNGGEEAIVAGAKTNRASHGRSRPSAYEADTCGRPKLSISASSLQVAGPYP